MINMLSSPERVIDFVTVMAIIFSVLITLIVVACFYIKTNARTYRDPISIHEYQSQDYK